MFTDDIFSCFLQSKYKFKHIYILNIYISWERKESQGKNNELLRVWVWMKVNLTVKWSLTFWGLIIPEASHISQDFSSRSKAIINSTQTSWGNGTAGPGTSLSALVFGAWLSLRCSVTHSSFTLQLQARSEVR